MTKELVEKLLELGIVEKVSKSEIQKMDLSKPIFLIKPTSEFLVMLYEARVGGYPGYEIEEVKTNVKKALVLWLDRKSQLNQQYKLAVDVIDKQIDFAVDILYRCFHDMHMKIQ
jgi:hypothetical protein